MIKLPMIVTMLMIWQGIAASETPSLPTFTVSAELSTNAIHPGAPLYVNLAVTRDKDDVADPATVYITSIFDKIHVYIVDKEGRKTATRPEASWPAGTIGFAISKPLNTNDSLSKTLIVHRWSSTSLEPGEYTVMVAVQGAKFRMESDNTTEHDVSEEPIEIALPIRVLPPDDQRVAEEFSAALDGMNDGSVRVTDRMLALDTLLLAQGPLALPAQLKMTAYLCAGKLRAHCDQRDLIIMFWCIAHSGNANTAKALIDFVKGPDTHDIADGTQEDLVGIWPVLSWTIHALHRLGSPETRRITRAFVEDNEQPQYLVERAFMHGAGIRVPRVY